MNSIQLEYFLTVARTGSFTAAAHRLYLSQPALSKQIRMLEEELGVLLMIRRPYGIHLTPEGRKLLSHAEEISRIIKDIPAEIKNLQHTISGELNIVCGPFLSRRLMPDLLKRLLLRYPGICPRIRETATRDQSEALMKGIADIGLGTANHELQKHLSFHPIFHSELVLIRSVHSDLASRKKVSKKEIAEHKLITYPQGSIMYDAVCRALAPFSPKVFMDSQSSVTIIELVREDFGIALVPDYLIEPDKRGDIIVGGFDSGEGVTVGYHYNPDRQLTPQARAFIGIVREKFSLAEE